MSGKQTQSPSRADLLRILHLSDTHNLHRTIEASHGLMPDADILLHTGDFTNDGTEAEYADFHDWLTSLKPRYKHILVIPGNHDFRSPTRKVLKGKKPAKELLDPSYAQKLLPNVKVLFHETVNIEGLTIFGSPWEPWQLSKCPEDCKASQEDPTFQFFSKEVQTLAGGGGSSPTLGALRYRYDELPPRTHIFMTHAPPKKILDCNGNQKSWGSSKVLRACVETLKPQVHCFGHLHSQRGYYIKDPKSGKYSGGVEYEQSPGAGPYETIEVPPASYPCQLISNNSMLNHHRIEGENVEEYLKGPPRLIIAQRLTELYDPATRGTGEKESSPSLASGFISDWSFSVATSVVKSSAKDSPAEASLCKM